jgi:hypothetical protein
MIIIRVLTPARIRTPPLTTLREYTEIVSVLGKPYPSDVY